MDDAQVRGDRPPTMEANKGSAPYRVRTLFIAPQVPWPLNVGSKIRMHNLLRCYSDLGDVTLICLAQNSQEGVDAAQLRRLCRQVICLPLRPVPPVGRVAALKSALDSLPRSVRRFESCELAGRVRSLLEEQDFDIVHVERLFMAQNARQMSTEVPGKHLPVRVLDLDDLESAKMKRMAGLQSWRSLGKYLNLLEWMRLRAYERRMLPRFDWALVCSEKDRRGLPERGERPVTQVFCNGADLEAGPPKDGQDDGRTLVFLGAMDYQPNEDAVLFFVREILPMVRRRVVNARLIIAGKGPTERVRALARDEEVLVTGYVEDKTTVFDQCTVFIVPLRVGGGTRIKILEAMAAGKPVVSTAIGCEGIEAVHGQHILIGDNPESFCEACVALLHDATLRQRLAGAGRELVEQSYRWQEIRGGYQAAIRELVSESRRTLGAQAGRLRPATPSRRTV